MGKGKKTGGRARKYGEPAIHKTISVPVSRAESAIKDVNSALDRYRDPEYKKIK